MIKNEYNYNYGDNTWELNGVKRNSFEVFQSMLDDIDDLVEYGIIEIEEAYKLVQSSMFDIMNEFDELNELVERWEK